MIIFLVNFYFCTSRIHSHSIYFLRHKFVGNWARTERAVNIGNGKCTKNLFYFIFLKKAPQEES